VARFSQITRDVLPGLLAAPRKWGLLLLSLLLFSSSATAASNYRRSKADRAKVTRIAKQHRAPRPSQVEAQPQLHNRILLSHWPELRGVDQVVQAIHTASPRARVQLTGGTAYLAVGALERGRRLNLDDLDLRVYGVTAEQLTAMVNRSFSAVQVSKHLEHGTPYSPEVLHVQFTVPRPGLPAMQLDVSIYSDPVAFDRPHQWVSTAKLKLEIGHGQRFSRLLDRVTRLKRGETMAELRDPSGRGLKDAWDQTIHVSDERGMPPQRQIEGLLHSIYLAGKRGPDWRVGQATVNRYAQMGQRSYRKFFRGDWSQQQARVRARYLINSFRPDGERDMRRVLEIGRATGLWVKLIPGLRAAIQSDARFERLVDIVNQAHVEALRTGKSRAWVFGALLSALPSRADVETLLNDVLVIVNTPEEPWRTDVLESYDTHHPRYTEN
jgi:hypothetical protein